ncbi:SusC/RagA family TonB-linked outer membrane protein [Marinilabiliaceae bacterium JC017]|nr:SusC/RagA family TonB-linked outer membrane protein [Marinilabiliaceae bacterium JC017]
MLTNSKIKLFMKKGTKWFQRGFLVVSMLCLSIGITLAQNVNISGSVSSAEDNQPIPGVSVVQKGTTNGTITDIDGNYSLLVPQGAIISFSFVGMTTKEVTVGASLKIDVVLSSSAIDVDEVVVTALGIKREKKALGYSVQEVGGDDLSTAREMNVVNSLSGKVAGVQIAQSSTGTGGSSRIVIRGNSSFNNNQPLLVVDGVPVDNFSSNTEDRWGNRVIDRGSGMQDLNPDDIETMSVLKGPAASALYGSRAAAGVILVTTKSGKAAGKKTLGVTYTGSFLFETPMTSLDVQNRYGQGSGGEFGINDLSSWGPKMDGQMITDYTGQNRPFQAYDNDIKDFLNTGFNNTHSIAVSAGSENVQFRGTLNYMDYNGMIPTHELNQYGANFRTTAQLSDKLSLDSKINYVRTEGKNRPKIAGDPDNAFWNYAQMPRSIHYSDMKTPLDENGDIVRWAPSNALILNPYFSTTYSGNKDERDRMIGFVSSKYEFTQNVSLQVRYGLDYYTQADYDQLGTGTPYWYTEGDVTEQTQRFYEHNADFLFSASDSQLGESKFGGSISLGGNIMYRKSHTQRMEAQGLVVPHFYSLSNAKSITGSVADYEKQINSLYAFGQLSYDNFLFLDVTARNDWSSTLPSDNRSYFYPSVALGWVVSDMVELPSWVSFAKLRGSWAQVGNDTDPYKLFQNGDFIPYMNGLLIANLPSELPAKDLKPEIITSHEFGADLKFLNNRLGVDFTYYNSTSKDQLMRLPVAPESGYSNKFVNAGEINNKGVELMIYGTPVRTNDFNWDVSFNYAKNKNEVVKLYPGTNIYMLNGENQPILKVYAVEGGEYGVLYGTTCTRNANGQIVVDKEGLPIKNSEETAIGNYLPKWTGGISNSFTYKNLNFSFLVDMSIGGDIYSGTAMQAAASGTLDKTEEGREAWYNGTGGILVDGVKEDGTANDIYVNPETYWNRVSGINEEWIYDATWVRLQEVTLGYTFSKEMLGKMGNVFNSLSLNAVGRNLFLFANDLPGIDPSSSYSVSNAQGIELGAVPSTRTWGFNVKVSF